MKIVTRQMMTAGQLELAIFRSARLRDLDALYNGNVYGSHYKYISKPYLPFVVL